MMDTRSISISYKNAVLCQDDYYFDDCEHFATFRWLGGTLYIKNVY